MRVALNPFCAHKAIYRNCISNEERCEYIWQIRDEKMAIDAEFSLASFSSDYPCLLFIISSMCVSLIDGKFITVQCVERFRKIKNIQ